MGSKSEQGQLHIFLLPYLVPGHMIPTMDMARLFATRGLKSTIVTTPLNVPFFAETIEINNQDLEIKIDLLSVEFPYESEEKTDPPSERLPKFFKAIALLQHPFEKLMEEFQPGCLLADSLFPWASSAASKFKIPCLSFHGVSYFYQCISSNLHRYQPHKKVSSDSEFFIVPDLPHEIQLTRLELPPEDKQESSNWLTELMDQIREGERSCFGVIMNSFYELEPACADYYNKSLGMKHWHVGPLFLYFKERDVGADQRGNKPKSSIDVNECMQWLNEKEPNSVVYICFGSASHVPDAQLQEIVKALESLGQNFILVVREEDTKECIPDELQARNNGQSLIIRGWAPQRIILDHQAVGGFVTHCGWNSILEAVTAGLPVVTWPRHAEQFYNEKLVTKVLKIGVPVGVKRWVSRYGADDEAILHKEEIMTAISKVMIGKEAEDMRNRAKDLKEMAQRAIDEGGSSYCSVTALIEELKSYKM